MLEKIPLISTELVSLEMYTLGLVVFHIMSQKMDDKHVKAQVQKCHVPSEKPTWAHLVIVGVYMQWAQYYYLTIVSNGPSKFSKICCLWSRMGPAFPSELSVYCLEWAPIAPEMRYRGD